MIGKTPTVWALQAASGSSRSLFLKTTGLAAAALLVAVVALGLANGSGRATASLRWRTAAGARLLGVNVYRGNKRLNRRLREASGGFLDRSAPRGMTSTYRLQAVALDGTRLWLETATAA